MLPTFRVRATIVVTFLGIDAAVMNVKKRGNMKCFDCHTSK